MSGAGMAGEGATPSNANLQTTEKTVDPGSIEAASFSAAVSTDQIQVRLRNLREHMPNASETSVKFAALLADRLNNGEIVPAGFNMAAELLLYDLQTGVNGFTNEPIISRLVGYPPMMYNLMRREIPLIADAVCPPEFAQGVRAMIDLVNQDMRG